MWTPIESFDCLGERGDIITVTREEAVERGKTLTRWISSRGGELLHLRNDGHFETANGGEIIARFPS